MPVSYTHLEVIKRKKLIEFEQDDSNNDLFNETANYIVLQINSKIKNVESDFKKIIELDNA